MTRVFLPSFLHVDGRVVWDLEKMLASLDSRLQPPQVEGVQLLGEEASI